MPVYQLIDEPVFPPPHRADPSGLLAVGGDLTARRLLEAYRSGVFPWYSSEDPILWWSPDPRCVLFPGELRISHSMRPVLNSGRFEVTFDSDFRSVISHCARVKRGKGEGTWITAEMKAAYCELHAAGHAHSVEVWERGDLAGGLYGVCVGGVFSGESMFALKPNASKVALIRLVERLAAWEFAAIDCQVHSDHLERLGAREIPRAEFLHILRGALRHPAVIGSWAACEAGRAGQAIARQASRGRGEGAM